MGDMTALCCCWISANESQLSLLAGRMSTGSKYVEAAEGSFGSQDSISGPYLSDSGECDAADPDDKPGGDAELFRMSNGESEQERPESSWGECVWVLLAVLVFGWG